MNELEQAAREFLRKDIDKYAPYYFNDVLKIMAAFARQQVEAETRRVADELADLLNSEFVDNGPSAFRSRLSTYVRHLRGEGE